MNLSDLVFIGIKGSVLALFRATGEPVWTTHLKGSDFVNVVLDKDRILATCNGEIFCLEPRTGDLLWHNRLKGYGYGLATTATVHSPIPALPMAAEHREAERRAAAQSST